MIRKLISIFSKGSANKYSMYQPLSNGVDNEDVSRYLSVFEDKVSNILKGKSLGWLDSFFMPPPGFPFIDAYALPNNYNIFCVDSKSVSFRIDLFCPEDCEFVINLGDYKLLVKCTSGIATVNKFFSIKLKNGYISISYMSTGEGEYFWVSGKEHKKLDLPDIFLIRKENVTIVTLLGSVFLIGLQYWSDKHSYFLFENIRGLDSKQIKSSPYWVREWEERARKLWHLSVAVMTLADISKARGETPLPDSNFIKIAYLISSRIAQFPFWRPSSSKSRVWERGNWASGFLLGAYGACVGVLSDFGFLTEGQRREIGRVSYEKGLSWLLREKRSSFNEYEFPSPAHWLKRSTNHGIVIISAALVGVKESIKVSKNRMLQKSVSKLEYDFWLLLKDSFCSGIYLEGIRYAQFSLQEALAYILYDYNKSGLSWSEYRNKLDFLLPFVEHCEVSAYPGASIPMISWGDCPVLPWKESVKNFLLSLPEKPYEYRRLSSSINIDIALLPRINKEILTTEPLMLASKNILSSCNRKRIETLDLSLKSRVFSKQVGTQTVSKIDGSLWAVYITSTRVHLTHNKDHDIGNYVLAHKDKICVGEISGRGEINHNSIVLSNTISPKIDDFYGSKKNEECIDRDYNGSLEEIYKSNSISIIKVYSPGLVYVDSIPKIKNFYRIFITSSSSGSPYTIVITCFEYESLDNLWLNHVFPNGYTLQDDGTKISATGVSLYSLTNSKFSALDEKRVLESNLKNIGDRYYSISMFSGDTLPNVEDFNGEKFSVQDLSFLISNSKIIVLKNCEELCSIKFRV